MVMATVFNKRGASEEFSKPCFGFLSYIEQWDEDNEQWDDEEDEYVAGPLSGFSSGELSHMVWSPGPSGCDGTQLINQELPEILAAFPQYFSGFKILDEDESYPGLELGGFDTGDIYIPLADQNMQTTVMGAMMLRNLIEYSSFGNSYMILRTAGFDVPFSFVMAMTYQCNKSFGSSEYSFWQGQGGDECVFGDEVTVADLINMMEGGLGKIYQGVFGDTEQGYGRYGNYGDGSAPVNPRTGRRCTLTDTTMLTSLENIPEDWDKTELLTINNSFGNHHRFVESEFLKLAQAVWEKVLKDNKGE
jgi:hypothetical protein